MKAKPVFPVISWLTAVKMVGFMAGVGDVGIHRFNMDKDMNEEEKHERAPDDNHLPALKGI